MVGDFLFKNSDHEFLTSHQVSVSRPVPKRTLRKWQMTESKTEKNYVGMKVVVALGDS